MGHYKTRQYTLKDGSINNYKYYYEKGKIHHVKTYFDKLQEVDEIKEIIKNTNIEKPLKLKYIVDFIKDKEEFNGLTLAQVRSFIYRTTPKTLNKNKALEAVEGVEDVINDFLPIPFKLNKIKAIIKDNEDLNTLTDKQLIYFIKSRQPKTCKSLNKLLNTYEEVQNIFNQDLTTGQRVDFIKSFIEDKEDFKNFDLIAIRNYVFRKQKGL